MAERCEEITINTEYAELDSLQPPLEADISEDDVPSSRTMIALRRLALTACLVATTGLASEVVNDNESNEAISVSSHLKNLRFTLDYANTSNWAGYSTVNPGNLDYITADWTIPTISCPSSGYYSVAQWAGVGGMTSGDTLYQTGTVEVCSGGTETLQGWSETVPGSGPTYYTNTIHTGDKMVAEVVLSGTTAYLYLQDWGSDPSQTYANWSHAPAIYSNGTINPSTEECIVEDPADALSGGLDALADFGEIDFPTASTPSFHHGCSITANDVEHIVSSTSPGVKVTKETMVSLDQTHDLAETSDPTASGAFHVTWDANN